MKKAKNIITYNRLVYVVLVLAILLTLVAIILVVARHVDVEVKTEAEYKSLVLVESGDTLSKLLVEQGFNNTDVLQIAKVLKSDADISSLRADSDKIEFDVEFKFSEETFKSAKEGDLFEYTNGKFNKLK